MEIHGRPQDFYGGGGVARPEGNGADPLHLRLKIFFMQILLGLNFKQFFAFESI